jgi:two-component system, NarL family, sensor kinase
MEQTDRVRELEIMKEIAETINRADELEPMLDDVLARLLEMTGLKAGWIFLAERKPGRFTCAADAGLPQALTRDGKQPMRAGGCWCLERFWDGRLQHAVNILSCKRLEDANRLCAGDTEGITHHATIPLWSGDELFGLLNVASPGKKQFTSGELALLQAVAFQIGTAAHRIQLYRKERKRADRFERLIGVAMKLTSLLDKKAIARTIVQQVGEVFEWPTVVLLTRDDGRFVIKCGWTQGRYAGLEEWQAARLPDGWEAELAGGRSVAILSEEPFTRLKNEEHSADGSAADGCEGAIADLNEACECAGDEAQESGKACSAGVPDACGETAGRETVSAQDKSMLRAGTAVPILVRGQLFGLLVAGGPHQACFDEVDAEVLEALASHASLAYENAWLYEQSSELARYEERTRIARDLHDSVSQMLFSLSLNARGLESALKDAPEAVACGLREVNRLSRDALAEMRAMIRQLRPSGLEEGLLTGLFRYGERIGIDVSYQAGEPRALPERIEEALWRIGQEALNNVSKHAGTKRASVAINFSEWEVTMTVADSGRGFSGGAGGDGYGMQTMRERAQAVGGTLAVTSAIGSGTEITVKLPL